MSFNTDDSWTVLSPIEQNIKAKIETIGTPLKDWDICINYGIKTGFNDAFIISGEKKAELIAADPKSAEIIRPILRGRDIKRYGYEFANLWLINTHNGLKDNSISRVEIGNYPAIKEHLDQYYDKLVTRADKGSTPYNLRNCAYMNDFSKQKIVFQEMVQSPCFCLDSDRHFMLLDTGRIITGEHLEYLLCLLNSTLFFFAIKHFYGGGALGEKGVRMKHTFFEKFNAYVPTEEEEHTLSELIKNDISSDTSRVIDNFFYTVYGLSREEIEFLENQL